MILSKKLALSLFAACDRANEIGSIQERIRKSILQFSHLIKKYIALRTKVSFSELSRSMVDELGILHSYKDEGTTESMGRWENVQELRTVAQEYKAMPPLEGLAAFLEGVSLVSDVDGIGTPADAVTLAEFSRVIREQRPSIEALCRLAFASGLDPQWAGKLMQRAEWLRNNGSGE